MLHSRVRIRVKGNLNQEPGNSNSEDKAQMERGSK